MLERIRIAGVVLVAVFAIASCGDASSDSEGDANGGASPSKSNEVTPEPFACGAPTSSAECTSDSTYCLATYLNNLDLLATNECIPLPEGCEGQVRECINTDADARSINCKNANEKHVSVKVDHRGVVATVQCVKYAR